MTGDNYYITILHFKSIYYTSTQHTHEYLKVIKSITLEINLISIFTENMLKLCHVKDLS